jgi:sortase A
MAKQADLYSPDEAAKMLGITRIRLFGMLTSGELEGHQDEWARWRIPARAIRRARQDPEPPSAGPGGSSEDDAEFRIAGEGEAFSSEENTTQTAEEPSEEEEGQQEEEDRERRAQSGIDAEEGSEAEAADGLSPPSGNGETPAPDAAPDNTKGESRSILGIVSGLASVTLLVAGLALLAFYVLNQESQDVATNSNDPESFNVPEIEAPQEETAEIVDAVDVPEDKTLRVTVPSMARIKDAPVPDTFSTDEESLKNHVGIHIEGSGFPWQEEANVYLAGHRLGYPGTSSWLGFWDLDDVKAGERITVTDANGTEYTYEVFKSFVVDPNDVWVTAPVPGKNILTLQTCTLPNYSQRLIVQAELVEKEA